jgi:hypothetical protein
MKMAEGTKLQTRIEKPWAVYHLVPKIIKIIKEEKNGLTIQDSEKQEYFPQIFLSHNNVSRFDNPLDAIDYLHSTYLENKERLIQTFLENFPTAAKHDYLQRMHDILHVHSQRQPKFTDPIGIMGEGPTRFIPSIEIPYVRRIDAMEPGYSEPDD